MYLMLSNEYRKSWLIKILSTRSYLSAHVVSNEEMTSIHLFRAVIYQNFKISQICIKKHSRAKVKC